MANPPGTIGPFVGNVPQPGSPIRSDWPIQVSNTLASKALFGARSTGIGLGGGTWTTLVSLTSTGFPAGKYLVHGALIGSSTAAITGSIRIFTATSPPEPQWVTFNAANGDANRLYATIGWIYTLPTAGSITINLQANPNVAGLTALAGTWATAAYVGY